MLAWPTLLVLLGACASSPRSPVAATTARQPTKATVRGHVRGVGGQPLRMAHLRLGATDVSSQPDGTFEVPLPEGGARVLSLQATGVDHRPAFAFIANEGASVTLDIELGTHGREATVAPRIALGKAGKRDAPQPMRPEADGTYVFDADIANGAYEYEICGLASGHCVNGSDGAGWHPDGEGDYASEVQVTNGHLHVVLEPKKLPPPGIEPVLSFGSKSSPSARLTRIHERMERLDRDEAAVLRRTADGRTPEPTMMTEKLDRLGGEAHRDLAAQLEGASGIVEQVALLAYVATMTGDCDADRARRLRTLLEPSDPMWALFPGAFAASVKCAPDPAYAERFVRENASTEASSYYFLDELRRTKEDPERHAQVLAFLKEPRFAQTVAAFMAGRTDPSRTLVAGKPMPAFSFAAIPDHPSAATVEVTNEIFAGKIYLIDVWATWCAPCRASLPKLHELNAKYGKRRDFGLVSVSIDENPADVVAFRKDPAHPMPWRNAIAKQSDVAKLAGVPSTGVPFLVLVDAKGTIIDATPDLDEEKLEADLARLLR